MSVYEDDGREANWHCPCAMHWKASCVLTGEYTQQLAIAVLSSLQHINTAGLFPDTAKQHAMLRL
jgi:hypothetical protein